MALGIKQSNIGSHLRALGFLLLIAVLVLQFIAPSVSAGTQPSQMAHEQVVDHSAHGMMHHAASGEMDADMQNTDCPHEGMVRCMPTMCCFHETSAPFSLVAVGLLLPNTTLVEQSIALPSHTRATKDRPPQHA
jgi:hypothetical protein